MEKEGKKSALVTYMLINLLEIGVVVSKNLYYNQYLTGRILFFPIIHYTHLTGQTANLIDMVQCLDFPHPTARFLLLIQILNLSLARLLSFRNLIIFL